MTSVFLVLIFVFSGIFVFAFVAGAVVFAQMFSRKEDDGSLNPQVIKNSLSQMRQAKPGMQLEGVKMQGFGEHLSSHVNDPRIMVPLLEAKLRWFDRLETTSDVEKITIHGTYGKKLVGYYVKPYPQKEDMEKNGSGCVALLVHGYTDSAAGMAYLTEEYIKLGFSVFAVDCRTHGSSEGNAITLGFTESKDIVLWVKEIVQRLGDVKIVLHGVSMGAAAVVQSLVQKKMRPYAAKIVLAVADCSFSSAKEQMSNQARVMLGDSLFQRIVAAIVLWGMSLVNFFVCGFFIGQNSPKKALKKKKTCATAQTPLLLFHGKKDAFVPVGMAVCLEKTAGKTATLLLVDEAPHIGSYFYAPNLYMKTISDLIGLQ